MEIGWIISNTNIQKEQFNAKLLNSSSSIKAEIIAILTALIVTPKGCKVHIFTDSANTINRFNFIMNTHTNSQIKEYNLNNS